MHEPTHICELVSSGLALFCFVLLVVSCFFSFLFFPFCCCCRCYCLLYVIDFLAFSMSHRFYFCCSPCATCATLAIFATLFEFLFPSFCLRLNFCLFSYLVVVFARVFVTTDIKGVPVGLPALCIISTQQLVGDPDFLIVL